jgi:methyltransferase-like protein
MKLENIEKLKRIERNRESSNGYMVNKERVYIAKKNLRKVTIAGSYDNLQFDEYIIKAILEKESDLLQRAFELEQIDYEETKKLAKIEAANILAEQELI